jgi:S-methylmethionine-dependent homocysteine/selenocysteine methylase
VSSFVDTVAAGTPILTDGGIETRLVYECNVPLPEHIEAAGLVGHPALRQVYASYLSPAEAYEVPLVLGTPTFRAGAAPAAAAGRDLYELNNAAVAHHRQLVAHSGAPVFIAGVLGPHGDAYTPADALAAAAAEEYHAQQVAALADAGVDLLFAATFPAVEEAVGVARAMSAAHLPYTISYVLGPDGRLLDGTSLSSAVHRVDSEADPPPLMHSLSCTPARTAARALATEGVPGRVLECKANASALTPQELVALDHLDSGDPVEFATSLWQLHTDYGVQVIGGCCGTDERHIRALGSLFEH